MTAEHGSSIFRLRPEPAQTTSLAPQPRRGSGFEEKPLYRILFVMACFGLLGAALVAQLVRYQAFGRRYQVLSGSAPASTVNPRLARGGIFDRYGNPLALESYVYHVNAAPDQIAEEDRAAVARRVAPMVGWDEGKLLLALEENSDASYLPLSTTVGPEVGEEIISWGVYTITAEAMPKRYYPEGKLFSHGLGFVNGERVGFYGVEGQFDDFLRSPSLIPPQRALPRAVGSATNTLPESEFLPTFVQQDLILTVDRVVQAMVESVLQEAVREHEAEGGVAIVLRPNGNAVLAMASYPDFNPNDYGSVEDIEVFVDPAISKLYEPGSVFKLITYAAALDKGVITPASTFDDEDEFIYGERRIQNWDQKGRGKVTAAEALAQSLNVTTAKIAVQLGREDFYKAVRRFGFGQITGVELDGEVPGIVKVPGRGGWYPADLAINSFGQGISVTPLQMANAVAAIASKGVLYRAHVLRQIIDGEKLITIEPQPVSRAISAETATTLTKIMVDTVERTPTAGVPGYAIAGKSGTAEIPLPEGYADELTITSFAGFFPADDPQFVILVKLDRPKTSRWATYTAAPLFQTIARNLIQLYNIPPDNIRPGSPAAIPAP